MPDDLSIPNAQVVCIPASEIADKLGSAKVANVVMMGALLEETECLSSETAMKVLEAKVKNPALLELDRKALDAGRLYIDHTVAIGAVDPSRRLRAVDQQESLRVPHPLLPICDSNHKIG